MLFLCIYIFAQILLESFPVSSSGHCALLEKWYFFLTLPSASSFESFFFLTKNVYKETFDALLHAPTLIILSLFFFKRWFLIARHPIRFRYSIVKLVLYVTVTTVIALFFYFVVHIQNYALPLGIGFLITLLLVLSTYFLKPGSGSLTVRSAVIIGFGQAIALLPGISRLGTTYALARWLGISSRRSLEISFVIQVPLLLAACAKSMIIAVTIGGFEQILNITTLLVMIIATVAAYVGLYITYYSALYGYWWYFVLYMIIPLSAWGIITVIS